MGKWKLMLSTLPIVAGVLAVKLVLEFVVQWPGVVDFTDVGIVLTAGVFLTGFMLAGVMQDYKESEKLPGEIAAILETIEEVCVQGAASRPNIDVKPLRSGVLKLTETIYDWLLKKKTQDELFATLTAFHGQIVQLERDGAGSYASRAVSELHNLRKAITRVAVISRTGFLPPAYAMLETLLALIVLLMMASRYKSTLAMCILVPFIALIYIYMIRLIKDIDDPFEYAPDGSKAGGAEVELFPLIEFRQRLASRVSSP
jgi:hypothetical protein